MEMENNCKNIKNPANAEYTINNVPSITEKQVFIIFRNYTHLTAKHHK